MVIPSYSITSASRQQVEDDGQALHKIQLDVETYSYVPKGAVKAVRIEGYERKRDLLAGEIARRRNALTLTTFNYRGARGRRDPWVDPRVPLLDGEPNAPSVPEQMAIIDDLSRRVKVLSRRSEFIFMRSIAE